MTVRLMLVNINIMRLLFIEVCLWGEGRGSEGCDKFNM